MKDRIFILDKKKLGSERKRFESGIIDFLFTFVSIFGSGFIIVITGNIFNWDIFSIWQKFVTDYTYLAFFTFLLLNYLFMEWLLGATIGKLATGMMVVTENGTKPNFAKILIRTLCRLIPFDIFSFLGKSGIFWHDSISKTYVVIRSEIEKDMQIFYNIDLIGQKK